MPFKLEISSIAELMTFLSLIKGVELDSEEIAKLTNILNTSATKLEDALKSTGFTIHKGDQ